MERTSEDGIDLALHIQKIFETFNTDKKDRLKTLDIQLNQFPYVNGHLFEEQLKTADFDRMMRSLNVAPLIGVKFPPPFLGQCFRA
jgi:hypothetical protein